MLYYEQGHHEKQEVFSLFNVDNELMYFGYFSRKNKAM